MLTVLRREEKYALSIEEAICYANRFSQLMMSDQFSKNGKYVVRSLYFDTMDDKDFHDKLNEQNQRRKVRLRIYNPDDQYAKLELKQKENIYQKKRSLGELSEEELTTLNRTTCKTVAEKMNLLPTDQRADYLVRLLSRSSLLILKNLRKEFLQCIILIL